MLLSVAASDVFGYPPDFLHGKSINVLMSEGVATQHDFFLKRFFEDGGTFKAATSRVVLGVKSDGSMTKIRIALSFLPQQQCIAALVDEVVDRTVRVTVDGSGLVVHIEGNVEEMLGFEARELVGRKLGEMYRGDVSMLPLNTVLLSEIRTSRKGKSDVQVCRLATDESSGMFACEFRDPDFSLESVISVDGEEKIVSASQSCLNLFGFTPAELVGMSVFEFLPRFSFEACSGYIMCQSKNAGVFQVAINVSKRVVENASPVYIAVIRRRNKTNRKKPKHCSNLPDEVLGWYTLVRGGMLGQGSCGQVSLAVHRLTGVEVAIKTLERSRYDAMNMEFPPVEITLLKRLQHTNICQLYHVIYMAHSVHMVMERMECDLFDYILANTPLSEDLIRPLFCQLLSGVNYMHSHGVVHRDIKAENALVMHISGVVVVKLIDVGFGKVFDVTGAKLMDTFCGSPDYAAPELWERKPYFGPAVDVWALGVLLYIMATEYLPFDSPSNVCAIHFTWPKRPVVSEPLRDLVGGIFRPAAQRLSSTEMLRHVWIIGSGNGIVPHVQDEERVWEVDILNDMEGFGFVRTEVERALSENEFNQLTATYHLLLQKRIARPANQN